MTQDGNVLLQDARSIHGVANRVPGRFAGRHERQADFLAASAQQRESVLRSRQSGLYEDRNVERHKPIGDLERRLVVALPGWRPAFCAQSSGATFAVTLMHPVPP